MCGGRKRPHGWKAMLLRSTFIDQSVILMDQSVQPFPRIPAKPNPGRPVAIHDLSFRKFQKLGRLTSFAVVSNRDKFSILRMIQITFIILFQYN